MYNADTDGCCIQKLAPSFKSFLWGGTQLKERFGKNTFDDSVAESWELSAWPDAESVIADGEYADLTLSEYIKAAGRDVLGTKAKEMKEFPLLIKLIDAAKPLSIQVHPGQDYALNHGSRSGKNEMWYVVSATEDAYIYYGLKEKISKDELKYRIEKHLLKDILSKVPVKAGDAFFVPTGMIHAIGDGIIMCEIQQNSDATYRIDDYGRKGADGHCRPLHIERAIDVTDMQVNVAAGRKGGLITVDLPDGGKRLISNKYFTTDLYKGMEESSVEVTKESFAALVMLSGKGEVRCGDEVHFFRSGDTFFVNAGAGRVQVTGSEEFLVVRV